MLLTLDSIVKVDVAIASAATVSSQMFDVGLLISSTASRLTTTIRAKEYESAAAMLADSDVSWAETDAEYAFAVKYFNANPAPRSLVIGYAATGESTAAVFNAIRDVNDGWYGVYWIGANASKIQEIDEYLNEIDKGIQFYEIAGSTPDAAVALAHVVALNAKKTFRSHGYYTATAGDVAAVMGTAIGCAHAYADQSWQICYRTINGATPTNNLSETQVKTLLGANLNVYVTRATNMNLYERGATHSGMRVGEVVAIDRMAQEMRDAIVSLMINNKLPQNDSTTTRFIAAVNTVLERYVNMDVIGSGIWRGDNLGEVQKGDVLDRGYVVYADSFDNQTAEDRAARKGMPLMVGLCLSGSVESVEINVTVQQ